jgi:hypothetical protein
VYSVITTTLPRFSRGISAFRGVPPLDEACVSEDGQPLITAAEAQRILGIRQRTVYEWRRRDYLEVRGLTEDGRELYDAGELNKVKDSPRKRGKVSA